MLVTGKIYSAIVKVIARLGESLLACRCGRERGGDDYISRDWNDCVNHQLEVACTGFCLGGILTT